MNYKIAFASLGVAIFISLGLVAFSYQPPPVTTAPVAPKGDKFVSTPAPVAPKGDKLVSTPAPEVTTPEVTTPAPVMTAPVIEPPSPAARAPVRQAANICERVGRRKVYVNRYRWRCV